MGVSYVDRFVVAVSKMGGSVEAEAKALAADLGSTPYETKMKLAQLPSIVLSTTDRATAQKLVDSCRARNTRAIVVNASAVIPASKLVRVREIEELQWDDISCLVRARYRESHDTVEVKKEKKFDAMRAVASGGLVMRSTQKREIVTHHETSEQVLYMFRSDGETPWIMHEQGMNYSGLGAKQQPTANLNFGIACDWFKARATNARYDDSLLRRPQINEIDLYAYLISLGA